MYHADKVLKINREYLLKEDEAAYKARCSGKLNNKAKKYRLIDLFSGAGGMSLGFSAKFNHYRARLV